MGVPSLFEILNLRHSIVSQLPTYSAIVLLTEETNICIVLLVAKTSSCEGSSDRPLERGRPCDGDVFRIVGADIEA